MVKKNEGSSSSEKEKNCSFYRIAKFIAFIAVFSALTYDYSLDKEQILGNKK
jgi:hypothetical protein